MALADHACSGRRMGSPMSADTRLAHVLKGYVPCVRDWLAHNRDSDTGCGPRGAIVLLERFGRWDGTGSWGGRNTLLHEGSWMQEQLQRHHRIELDPRRWEAVVAVVGIWAAAQAGPRNKDPTMDPPDHVFAAAMRAWLAVRAHPDVSAAEVIAWYLAGPWCPTGVAAPHEPWEPASLVVLAVIRQAVERALRNLAGWKVAPVDHLWEHDRARFDGLVARGAHVIAAQLVSPAPASGHHPRLGEWNCEDRPLFEWIFNAVLGPGPHGRRPQACEYPHTPFGAWLEPETGITVGNELLYAPAEGPRAAGCASSPATGQWLTWRRNRFVVPDQGLPDHLRSRGHVLVKLWPCKNPECVGELRAALTRLGERNSYAQPLSPSKRCTHCGTRCGQRPVSVWRTK